MASVPCYLVDTNVLLRFLTGDVPEQAAKSKRLIAAAIKGDISLEIPFITIVETFHTLQKFYRIEKTRAVEEILKILNASGVRVSAPRWFDDAIARFLSHKISFADACIAAEAHLSNRVIASFDSDFELFSDVSRFEPR